MKLLKLGLITAMAMGLANCKISFEGEGTITDLEDETYYTGDIASINYLRDLNRRFENRYLKLSLKVNRSGKITGYAEDAKCSGSGEVSVRDYDRLAKSVEDAETIDNIEAPAMTPPPERNSSANAPVAGNHAFLGQEYIQLQTDHGKRYKAYFRAKTPLLVRHDAAWILQQVEDIAADLLLDCHEEPPFQGVYNYLRLESVNEEFVFEPTMRKVSTTTRKFKVTVDNNAYVISGSQTKTSFGRGCAIELDNMRLPAEIGDAMNSIDIEYPMVICMAMPMGNNYLEMTVAQPGGTPETGRAGCYSSPRLVGHHQFMEKLEAWLAQQRETCWESHN